jgi:cardiolipin synthase
MTQCADASPQQDAPGPTGESFHWLRQGKQALETILEAITQARSSIRLETFIFVPDAIGNTFRAALVAAQRRGVRVQVMCDAVGSFRLPADYWKELVASGGEFRWFNPLQINRFIYRDHRKIFVMDDQMAFIGGFNISLEYSGDGVTSGWRDLGLKITGPLAHELADAFDDLFGRADFRHQRFQRLRRSRHDAVHSGGDWQLLLTGPGRGHQELKQSLAQDFSSAKSIRIISAYFLPSLRLLRKLKQAARRGARVQLILAGKSDVWLMRMATRGLYGSLLRAGVEIYEYQPQILHAKVIIVDEIIYAGSANLDPRSLGINYEVLARISCPELAAEAGQIFEGDLPHCHRIDRRQFGRGRGLWDNIIARWAFIVLARLDPYFARRQRRTHLPPPSRLAQPRLPVKS